MLTHGGEGKTHVDPVAGAKGGTMKVLMVMQLSGVLTDDGRE